MQIKDVATETESQRNQNGPRLTALETNDLLAQSETGMGYQVVEEVLARTWSAGWRG